MSLRDDDVFAVVQVFSGWEVNREGSRIRKVTRIMQLSRRIGRPGYEWQVFEAGATGLQPASLMPDPGADCGRFVDVRAVAERTLKLAPTSYRLNVAGTMLGVNGDAYEILNILDAHRLLAELAETSPEAAAGVMGTQAEPDEHGERILIMGRPFYAYDADDCPLGMVAWAESYEDALEQARAWDDDVAYVQRRGVWFESGEDDLSFSHIFNGKPYRVEGGFNED